MLFWLLPTQPFDQGTFNVVDQIEVHFKNNKTDIKYDEKKRVNPSSKSLPSSTLLTRLSRVYVAKENYVINKIELNPSFYTK